MEWRYPHPLELGLIPGLATTCILIHIAAYVYMKRHGEWSWTEKKVVIFGTIAHHTCLIISIIPQRPHLKANMAPADDDLTRMEAATKASKEKREKNQREKEDRDKKKKEDEDMERAVAAGKSSKEKRRK